MYSPYFYPNGLCTNLAVYNYPQNVRRALELIADAVSGEKEVELFYNYLINIAPNQDSKNIVIRIFNDEMCHFKMFRTIYYRLTGELLPCATAETCMKPRSFGDGIKMAIEIAANLVVKYEVILFAMPKRVYINMLTEIINDELRNGSLFNLLLTMYFHPELAQMSCLPASDKGTGTCSFVSV